MTTPLWSYDFEAGVASGTPMTTANSNFKNLVQPGWTFSNAHLLAQGGGSLAGRCAPNAATCQANDNARPFASTNVINYRFYAYIEKVPTTTATVLPLWAGPTPGPATTAGDLRFTSTGAVALRNNSSTQVATSGNILPAGTYARIEGQLDVVNNKQQVKVFTNANINGTTPDYDSGLVTSASGGVGITSFAFGFTTSTTATVHFDNLVFSNAGWIGPVASTNQPPTANAGSNQTVAPWSTVTLTGTDSDIDGTVVDRVWGQLSGTQVTYTNVSDNVVTFTAPPTINGDTGIHQYTVTDDQGASDSATVQVTTTPVQMRAVKNGVEVPMRFTHVHNTTVQTPPDAPRNVVATLSGSSPPYSVTVTWDAPLSDGGSPITGYTVTRRGNGSHSLGATAVTDTFTGLTTAPPYTFDVVANNVVGQSPVASANTGAASASYRFPGDTLPLVTGKILLGCTEADNDGTHLKANWEYNAPEADTGKKYSIIKIFYSGGSVESCFTPSTGGIAQDMKAERTKGHIILANIAIQQSSSSHWTTWRNAADLTDSVVYNTYYNFIQWCEEGADAPSVPIWVCMPHEAQGPDGNSPSGHKVRTDTASGMLSGDYADMQWAFRTCMDDYAKSKTGGTDPTVYKWKRLAFGGIHTGDAFTASDYRGVENFYISYKNGNRLPNRVHDFVGGDPYQQPISGATTIGRTGVAMWNNVSKAMMAWCNAHGVPCVWGEFGIHNTDGDAGPQLQAFFDEVTNGTHDIPAIIYFNSAPDVGNGGTLGVGGTGRFLFANYPYNDPSKGTNGNFYNVWKSLMANPKVVHYQDLGY